MNDPLKVGTLTDPKHEGLNKELETDIEAYTRGGQRSFPISKKLAASVERWPVATEEIIVYRGQPKEFNLLPMSSGSFSIPFFSSTTRIDIAKKFAALAPKGGQVFMIKIQPGVHFLVISGSQEGEVLVESNGIAKYGAKKERVSEPGSWTMATPVIYNPPPPKPTPPPTGGRRKTRRRTRLRGSSKAGRSGRYRARHSDSA
jgi:hypothetical protein